MSGWTPERRKRQAAMIRQWRPWDKSTGPRTNGGKARAARNAYKGGTRRALRELSRLLSENQHGLCRLSARLQATDA